MNALSRAPHRGFGLMNEWDDLFNGFLSPVKHSGSTDHVSVPAMDIVETEENYVVKTDLPGVTKENLKVQIKDKLLTIEAQRVSEKTDDDSDVVIKMERRSGKYSRSLRLGNAVNEAGVSADYADGVLTLTLPKAVKTEAREIAVAVH